MDQTLYKIAALKCRQSYSIHKDLGTTEYYDSIVEYNGSPLQVLAIPGTNESLDWFWNMLLVSWDGVKLGAYLAAEKIEKSFLRLDLPLLIACHSKAGPTGLRLKQKYGADYCVAFAPARGFRHGKAPVLENTVIFTDPDDLVDKVGFLSFRHPECEFIEAPDDHFFPSVGDHVMDHWVEFLNA